GPSHLHSLCRIADGPGRVVRCCGGAILPRLDAHSDHCRGGSRRAVFRGERAVAEIGRRKRRTAPSLADLRLVGLRLLFWLSRSAARRAARRGGRCAHAICGRSLSRKSLLHRKQSAMSAMPQRPRQLALALEHTESYAREDFMVGSCNELAFQLV